MSRDNVYQLPSVGGPKQAVAKRRMLNHLKEAPKQDEELIANLGLFTRSVILAKTLYLNELYERIIDKPGVLMEFGVWWGANLAVLGSLRAIYEPYNRMRKVIGFDTFEGYPTVSAEDGTSKHASVGGYAMPEGYEHYLADVLATHEDDNVLDHVRKFELVKGDAPVMLKAYLDAHPETVVAMAYLDLAMYEPTKSILESILPRMVRGGVIALDELGSARFPGETRAFQEIVGVGRFKMERSRFLPDRTIVTIE